MRRTGIALLAALWASGSGAQTYAVGEPLEALELEDQHGQLRRVDESRRALLFTRDMDAGGVLREALAGDGAAVLDAARAAYVADVSGMPAFVRRMFALPGLRRRPYPVLLDADGTRTVRLPSREGAITWLGLDALRIVEIRHLRTVEEVRQALGAPPR